jgi:hypothetical protein
MVLYDPSTMLWTKASAMPPADRSSRLRAALWLLPTRLTAATPGAAAAIAYIAPQLPG